MKFRQLLIIIAILSLLGSCSINRQNGTSEYINKGNGNVISREISITNYTEIEASNVAKIIYSQDLKTQSFLKYEIDENLLDFIDIEVKNNKLTINVKENINTPNFKIYTNSPSFLEKVSLSGAASLEIERLIEQKTINFQLSGASNAKINAMSVDKLTIQQSGASNLILNELDAQTADLQVSGSSVIKVNGSTQYLKLGVSGVSDVNAFALKAKLVGANISGSSNTHIQVTDSLIIKASGASEVKYKGTPSYVQVHNSGNSSVKQTK